MSAEVNHILLQKDVKREELAMKKKKLTRVRCHEKQEQPNILAKSLCQGQQK